MKAKKKRGSYRSIAAGLNASLAKRGIDKPSFAKGVNASASAGVARRNKKED
jgi:hypothetical protein